MPLGAPPLAFPLSLPGAATGCWACERSVTSTAKAATNTGAIRSFMTDDCTRNGGRLLRGQVQGSGVATQFVTMVRGVLPALVERRRSSSVVSGRSVDQADPGGALSLGLGLTYFRLNCMIKEALARRGLGLFLRAQRGAAANGFVFSSSAVRG